MEASLADACRLNKMATVDAYRAVDNPSAKYAKVLTFCFDKLLTICNCLFFLLFF